MSFKSYSHLYLTAVGFYLDPWSLLVFLVLMSLTLDVSHVIDCFMFHVSLCENVNITLLGAPLLGLYSSLDTRNSFPVEYCCCPVAYGQVTRCIWSPLLLSFMSSL